MANDFNLRLPPKKLLEQIETIDHDAKSKYVDEWDENLEHASGWLTESTKAATAALVGTSLALWSKDERYGAPNPLDVLRPTLARYLGRHMALFGGVQVTPKTARQEEKDQSEAAEKVLSDKWERCGLDIACMEAMFFSVNASHGAVLVEGDDTLNAPEAYQIDSVDPLTGQPTSEQRVKKIGDVIFKSISPFQYAIDPGAASLEDSDWLLVKEFLTEEEIARRWPSMEQVQTKTGETPIDQAEPAKYDRSKMDNLVQAQDKTRRIVLRLFLRSHTTERPLGEQYVFVGKTEPFRTVNDQGQPWMGTYDNKYPLVDFRDEPLHVGYWGRGRQSAARPMLKALCSVWSRLANILSLPLIIARPEGSTWSVSNDLSDAPFASIEYNPAAGPPQFLAPPNIPAYYAFIQWCIDNIGRIYSQGEVSRGEMPPARTPAESVRQLQSADVLADSPQGKMMLKSMTRLFERVLGEGLRVWPDEYYVTVLGADRQSKRYTLRKKPLEPGVDIRITPGDDSPKSRNALASELTEMARYQLLPPRDFRRLMGTPIKEDMFDPDGPQLEAIAREEISFEAGLYQPTHWADDHELHKQKHERRSTERKNELPLPSEPGYDEAFAQFQTEDALRLQHNQEHIKALTAAAAASAGKMAQPGPGMPTGAPPAAPPAPAQGVPA